MPVGTALEAKQEKGKKYDKLCFNKINSPEDGFADTLNGLKVAMLHLDDMTTLRLGTPADKTVTLDKVVRNQLLVALDDASVDDELKDGLIVYENVALVVGTADRVTLPFLHNLRRQVGHPAVLAKLVATGDSDHVL